MLGPILKNTVESSQHGVRLIKINVDQHPDIAQKYNVSALPTVVLLHKGKILSHFVGFKNQQQVNEFLDKNMPQ
jgi:thioredoxin-like negative regulator of GroEL